MPWLNRHNTTYSSVSAQVWAEGSCHFTMWHVYAIYNLSNDKVYIGQTSNLNRRLAEHTAGRDKTSFTSRFDGGWVLIYKEEVSTSLEALAREKYLKSYRGRQYIKALIPR